MPYDIDERTLDNLDIEIKELEEQVAAKDAEIERLSMKTLQAYQVLGVALTEKVSQKEGVRALDYFCDDKLFDEDFLPFPRDGK